MPPTPAIPRTRRRAVESPEPDSLGLGGLHWTLPGLLLILGGSIVFLSLMTYDHRYAPAWLPWVTFVTTEVRTDPNVVGKAGTVMCSVLTNFLGAGAFLLPACLVWLGVAKMVMNLKVMWRPLLGGGIALVGTATFLAVQRWVLQDWDLRYQNLSAGGGVGGMVSQMLSPLFGSYLTGLVAVVGSIVGFIYMFGYTVQEALAGLKLRMHEWQMQRAEQLRELELAYAEDQKLSRLDERIAKRTQREEIMARRAAARGNYVSEDELSGAPAYMDAEPEAAVAGVQRKEESLPSVVPKSAASNEPQFIDGAARRAQEQDPAARKLSLAEWRKQRENSNRTERPSGMASALSPLSEAYKFYQLPDFDLLHWEESDNTIVTDKGALIEVQKTIIKTLASFNVAVSPSTITRGPSITRYEIIPTEGLRVKRIAELEADLARATKAEYINILAPIPGRETVGIEIANSDKVPVPLRELLEDPKFTKGKARIPLALGKDVYGETVIADLAAMPHLLVAGTTGSGKSVCINSIIASLLFQFTPDQLRFIMVDPKVVEMQIFNDLPHLIVPVVTEPKKVLAALRWCVNEMEHRYRMFANEGVRNFESFNSRKRKEPSPTAGTGLAGAKKSKPAPDALGPELPLFDDLPPPPPLISGSESLTKLHVSLGPDAGALPEGDPVSADFVYNAPEELGAEEFVELANGISPGSFPINPLLAYEEENGTSVEDYYADDADDEPDEDAVPDKVPYIVIIIDELADLMQTASADVENEIARLTQKARAAGIHLIVATQTPRANVITGVIKANIPSRIAFQVASGLDSRVILDGNGAEKLVGKGDMLYLPPGTSKLIRVQGAFITDDEITALVQHCKEQGKPMYDTTVQKSISEAADGDEGESADVLDQEEENMLERCIEVIVQERIASTSRLQRRLKLGYTRAARMMDILEKRGIVGPADGIKPREILVSGEDY